MNFSQKMIDLAKGSLAKKIVYGVVTIKRTTPRTAVHVLATSQEMLNDTDPLIPYFPGNAANFIKSLTKIAPPSNKILVILRPCEMRAVVELVKLAQIKNENLIFLVHDCPGTIPRRNFLLGGTIPTDDEFLKKDNFSEIREICKICQFPRHDIADIGFLTFEENTPFVAYSEIGRELLNGLGIEYLERPLDKGIDKVENDRKIERENFCKTFNERYYGIDNLMETFASCVNCHNCMSNCPICICHECFFESEAVDFEGDAWLEISNRKGGLRAPTDTMLFHLGRMAHMTTSCVSCGACEEVCPQNIPVGVIFSRVAENVQSAFDYIAGRRFDEELPLKTFREDELSPK